MTHTHKDAVKTLAEACGWPEHVARQEFDLARITLDRETEEIVREIIDINSIPIPKVA